MVAYILTGIFGQQCFRMSTNVWENNRIQLSFFLNHPFEFIFVLYAFFVCCYCNRCCCRSRYQCRCRHFHLVLQLPEMQCCKTKIKHEFYSIGWIAVYLQFFYWSSRALSLFKRLYLFDSLFSIFFWSVPASSSFWMNALYSLTHYLRLWFHTSYAFLYIKYALILEPRRLFRL